jgi:hypothetical protein
LERVREKREKCERKRRKDSKNEILKLKNGKIHAKAPTISEKGCVKNIFGVLGEVVKKYRH